MASRAVCIVLTMTAMAAGKARQQANRNTQTRKRECEVQCASVEDDDKPNCILRCQSEACYNEIYGQEELEPGEIDMHRQRLYNTCLVNEQRRSARQQRDGGQRKQATSEREESPAAAVQVEL